MNRAKDAKEWIEMLPCGLKVDLLKNECCKTVCPNPNKRGNSEAIEKCEYWIGGGEG